LPSVSNDEGEEEFGNMVAEGNGKAQSAMLCRGLKAYREY